MKIAIVGTGYVGLVTGACMADTGVDVVCVDVNEKKLADLRAGILPIYEPGLDAVVARNVSKDRLVFSSDLQFAVTDSDVVFIAVGTPPGDDGAADMTQVLHVAASIGAAIANRNSGYVVVVTKSTVPVGTAVQVRDTILEAGAFPENFDVASNPEFLKEGAAVDDFARPDRIVIGVDSDRAKRVLERLYRPFLLNNHPVLFMDVASAEITKYAANAMLALRISFINAVSNLCDAVGADVNLVRHGIGSDPRIGSSFLYAGAGYGGSCFPKDVRALESTAAKHGLDFGLLGEVERINDRQKLVPVEKAARLLELSDPCDFSGMTIAVWGLAFKPNTDDTREAPALTVIAELLRRGARIRLYDPVASHPFTDRVEVCSDAYDAAAGADLVLLLTEWGEFRNPDSTRLAAAVRRKLIVDARNVLDAADLNDAGFAIASIGRPTQFPTGKQTS